MTRRLETYDFEFGSLSLKRVAEGEFQVQICDTPVGQIMRRKRSFGRVVWFWSLSGPHIPETMKAAGSNAQTYEGAKEAVKRTLDDWLCSATGRPGNMLWDKSSPKS